MSLPRDLRSVLNLTVIVAGLGYFVDLFDIALFGVVRAASLKDLGLTDPGAILNSGIFIYNCQMIGMMVGGLGWGVLADKRGRLPVMFGSILLYSFANIANAFVWDVPSYAVCRFLGGLGLAGELGAAITLVAEFLPKEKRGLGTAVVAALGMLGIATAAIAGQVLHWKTAYLAGGAMGLALLFARFRLAESALFIRKHNPTLVKPSLLLRNGRFFKYICCILVGVPNFFVTGVLFTFSPEITAGLKVEGPVIAGIVILFGSIGLAVGDLVAGSLSQVLKSRKRAVALHLAVGFALLLVYFLVPGFTSKLVYAMSVLLGISVGYWAVLVTIAAEQYGTNIRATVATTVPNFVRGSAAAATSAFAYLKGHMPVSQAALTVGVICFSMALLSLLRLDETFHRDLDYEEGPKSG